MNSPLDKIGGRLFVAFVLTLATLATLAGLGHASATEIVALFGLFAGGKAVEKRAHATLAAAKAKE